MPDVPLLVNMVDGGKTPMLPAQELETMGFQIAIYPTTAWTAAIKAMQRVLGRLKETETPRRFMKTGFLLKPCLKSSADRIISVLKKNS